MHVGFSKARCKGVQVVFHRDADDHEGSNRDEETDRAYLSFFFSFKYLSLFFKHYIDAMWKEEIKDVMLEYINLIT